MTDAMAVMDLSNKKLVITGASAGMGAATARLASELGAEVHAIDIADINSSTIATATANGGSSAADNPGSSPAIAYRCDLSDRHQIDATVADLPGRIDALLNCAGIPNGGRFDGPKVMAVNWLGLRHLTESLLGRIPAGGAVVHVASTAGRDWARHRDTMEALMAASSFEAGADWVAANPDLVGDGYVLSKQAVQYYTLWRSLTTIARDVRMNSICPGVTNTAIVADFRRGVGDEVLDRAIEIAGRMADPTEMAAPLLFLADPVGASYINGVNLNVDRGTGAAHLTGAFD